MSLAPIWQRIWQLRPLDELEGYITPWWMEGEKVQDADEELTDAEK
jgi:hypothetical protein